MPDARLFPGPNCDRRAKLDNPEQDKARGWVPAADFRVEAAAIGSAHVEPVLAPQRARCREHQIFAEDDATCWPSAPVDLNH